MNLSCDGVRKSRYPAPDRIQCTICSYKKIEKNAQSVLVSVVCWLVAEHYSRCQKGLCYGL